MRLCVPETYVELKYLFKTTPEIQGVMSNMSVLGAMSAGGYVRGGQNKRRGFCPQGLCPYTVPAGTCLDRDFCCNIVSPWEYALLVYYKLTQ